MREGGEISKTFTNTVYLLLSLHLKLFLTLLCRYTIIREATKPSFVRLDKRTNEELTTRTKHLCDVRKALPLHFSLCSYLSLFLFL